MVIYNGVHYDALVVAASPKAKEEDDVAQFNPRTKRGKMILQAAQKLVEINHRGSKFFSLNKKVALQCDECGTKLGSQKEATLHAGATGHTKYSQVKS